MDLRSNFCLETDAAGIVCHCLQVRESDLRETIVECDLSTVRDVRRTTGAGEGCTACHARIRQLLQGAAREQLPAA